MPWVVTDKVVCFSYIFTFRRSKIKMENIEKFHSLLPKFNDVIVVERHTESFFIFNKWSGRSLQHVSSYTLLVNSRKRISSIINLSGVHRLYFILFAIVIWCRWRPFVVCKVCITHCFFNTCSFILMKLTCAWILEDWFIFKFDLPCLF